MEISQDQLIGGDYADGQRQSLHYDHILDLWYTADVNSWYRIGEVGKKIEIFTKVIRAYMDFLQTVTSAVNRMIPDSEARQIIIKFLAFEKW